MCLYTSTPSSLGQGQEGRSGSRWSHRTHRSNTLQCHLPREWASTKANCLSATSWEEACQACSSISNSQVNLRLEHICDLPYYFCGHEVAFKYAWTLQQILMRRPSVTEIWIALKDFHILSHESHTRSRAIKYFSYLGIFCLTLWEKKLKAMHHLDRLLSTPLSTLCECADIFNIMHRKWIKIKNIPMRASS